MHIFFSGVGGTAIGPLALIAKQAGYTISGSDKQESQYLEYLRKHGIKDIHVGQEYDQIAVVHDKSPIDWYVYSSAVAIEQPDAPEIRFCQDKQIRTSKRDEFINHLIDEKNLKLVAVAGTHGKTTTTAMLVWLFKQLSLPITYSVGAKIPFGEMGEFSPGSEYFVLEADEFDRNFLAFHPALSIITGVDWDHHEIFPTREDYQQAFKQFVEQSDRQIVWQEDAKKLDLADSPTFIELNKHDNVLKQLGLVGEVNRQNAWQVISALHELTRKPLEELVPIMNRFPGLSRRFEKLADNLYSDYAHTTLKIRGCLQTAFEISPNVVVVYEPLTNRRQHFIKDDYKDLFAGVKKLYWVPSYLAREDPEQAVLSPVELIDSMGNKEVAEPATLDDKLKQHINKHRQNGDLVVCISGGGGSSLDEWARQNFIKA